jgi:hypothetical protein
MPNDPGSRSVMPPEELSRIDGYVSQFRDLVCRIGSLKRLNRNQRALLSSATSLVLSLPALLRGPADHLYYPNQQTEAAASWRALTFTLKHVDPLWYTRGVSGVQAAHHAVGRLVDPEVPPTVRGRLEPNLRDLVLRHFGEDERNPVNTDAYFDYLGDRMKHERASP